MFLSQTSLAISSSVDSQLLAKKAATVEISNFALMNECWFTELSAFVFFRRLFNAIFSPVFREESIYLIPVEVLCFPYVLE